MPTKLAILHFNILEKYPPAMNFIRDLERSDRAFKILVISSKNNTSYINFTTTLGSVIRLGTIYQSRVNRYITYLIFNLVALFRLICFKPQEILVFETLSVWPTYVYKKINKHVNIHIHHHEYTTIEEIVSGSLYVRFLHRIEKQLFNLATFSHTNDERKALYLEDNPKLLSSKVGVYPNLPPQSWWNEYGSKKRVWVGPKIKLVYVGALDLETMYVREVVDWVLSNPDLLELTFISHQMNAETLSFVQSNSGNQIKLIEPINYNDLPKELIKYDIGLVLYNGHILNYIYNIPNKVFEYLFCGLKVIGDTCLISTSKLNHSDILLSSFKDGLKPENIIEFTQRHFEFECLSNNSLSQNYI